MSLTAPESSSSVRKVSSSSPRVSRSTALAAFGKAESKKRHTHLNIVSSGVLGGRGIASQKYFWHSSWQLGEREAEADLRSGRYKDFDSVEDLLSYLRA